MRASTIWVLLVAVLLTVHGGFTVASTLVLEDKVARLQAIIDSQGDASSDLSTCTEILSRAVRNELTYHGAPPPDVDATGRERMAQGARPDVEPVLLTSTH